MALGEEKLSFLVLLKQKWSNPKQLMRKLFLKWKWMGKRMMTLF